MMESVVINRVLTKAQNAGLDSYFGLVEAYVGYASPTDMVCLQGSDTKDILINTFTIRINATSGALRKGRFYRRIVANSGGSPTIITPVKDDTNSPDPTATLVTYGAAPTIDAVAPQLIGIAPVLTTAAAAAPGSFALTTFHPSGDANTTQKGILLRGANQSLCFNWGVALDAGFTALVTVHWSEGNVL